MLTDEQKLRKSVEILKRYNLWRRDTSVKNMHEGITPRVLGFAIDYIVDHLEEQLGEELAP